MSLGKIRTQGKALSRKLKKKKEEGKDKDTDKLDVNEDRKRRWVDREMKRRKREM